MNFFLQRILVKIVFLWGRGGEGDARVNDFFFGGGGGGTRVSDFFTKNPNLKKKRFYFSLFGGGWGRGE